MIWIILFVIVAGVVGVVAYARLSGPATPPAWLPDELKTGTEYCRERQFEAIVEEFTVVAKPDRVYKLADGRLCVTEYKTRPGIGQVYDGDVWQLSAGAAALAGAGRVAEFGFVIVQDRAGQRQSHQVKLLDRPGLVEVMRRFDAIQCGSANGSKTRSKKKCASCGHRAACA